MSSLYNISRSYDGVGNVTSAQTTLGAGTDNQAFCYDEQNRLVWASSQSATGPCGAANTAGTLTSQGAPYTASYSYDALNRLTSGPLGSYTYGDPAHLHAVTTVANGSSSYTAAYNFVGEMTCRAPDSGATCAVPNGSKTGAGLGYNNEGQQIGWQNTLAGTPTTTAHAAYDGEGHRVATNVVSNGVTTSTTDYLAGGLEEVTTAGSTTTLTKYESVPGVCSVVIVGSGPSEAISYVTTDGLGSVSEALDGNGNVTAQQLYGPYGTGRYSLGSMPTGKGYTGQYGDATTGLDYYGARYYDPLVGQFTSADTAGDGLNRYAYVHDDPETFTDPTGHFRCDDSGCKRGGGNGGAGGCTFDCKGSPSSGCGACKAVVGSTGGRPPKPNPVTCGSYKTQAQCDQAAAAQAAAVNQARRSAGVWQLIAGVVGGMADIYLLIKDLKEGIDPDKAFDVAVDIVGLVVDAGQILEGIGNLWAGQFGDNGVMSEFRAIGGFLGQIGNVVRGALNAFESAPGFLVTAAKWTLAGAIATASALTGEVGGAIGLMDYVIDVAAPLVKFDPNRLLNAGLLVLQGFATDQATHADDLAGETPFGFCTSKEATAACPAVA